MLTRIAGRDLLQKPVQHLLTILVSAIAIGLAVAIMLASASLKQGMTDASMPFDMIVGAKGSATQLIFNTIFLQDTPLGNVPAEVRETLEADERVRRVIPFAFGDNYGGYRIVGSTQDIFDLRPSLQDPSIFQLAEGRFYDGDFEAVVGANAARALDLTVGDTFQSEHGLSHGGEVEHHQQSFTVVGVLESMGRPYDNGIFVTIDSIWSLHGTQDGSVTALMVTPEDYGGLMQLYQEINARTDAQAVFPGVVMGEIFSLLGQTEDIMRLISRVTLLVALISMAVSLSWSVMRRARDNAILRAIGAGRSAILRIVMLESAIIVLCASALGLLLGHLAAAGIGHYMRTTTAMYAPVGFLPDELTTVGITAALSLALAMIPALRAYRTDVARGLTNG